MSREATRRVRSGGESPRESGLFAVLSGAVNAVMIPVAGLRLVPNFAVEEVKTAPCAATPADIAREMRVFVCREPAADACAICLGDIGAGATCGMLRCGHHAWHAECVADWLSHSAVCPLCRADAVRGATARSRPIASRVTGWVGRAATRVRSRSASARAARA